MIDMNQFEDVPLFAYNHRTDTWRRASLSGLVNQRLPNVFRVDPGADENLEDYRLYKCRHPINPATGKPDTSKFIAVEKLPEAIAVYS